MAQTPRIRPGHLSLAALCVATGALAGIWGPQGLVAFLVMVGLLRICWLEDNITNDLVDRETLPNGYINTAIQRQNFLWHWFRITPEDDITRQTPQQLATLMRAEIQVWACLLLGYAATFAVALGPLESWGNLALGAGIFGVALRRADTLSVSLAHCAVGRVLPRDRLLPRPGWVVIRRPH